MNGQPSVRLIAELVARHFDVEYRELLSNRRQPHLVRARHVAMYLARKLTSQSLPDIGRHLARDHTTIIHGCRQIDAAASAGSDFAEELLGIEAAVLALSAASQRVPVTPTPDHDAISVATRILNEPRGPTSISIDELTALATAVTAANDKGMPEELLLPSPKVVAPRPSPVIDAAGELIAALRATDEASQADRGSIIAARQRLIRARSRMTEALYAINPPNRQEKNHAVHTAQRYRPECRH